MRKPDMTNALSKILGLALFALTLFAPFSPALADSSHQRFVVFGDSLSDPGNAFALLQRFESLPFGIDLIPEAPYEVGKGHFSNGPTWIEQLATREHAGASAGPALVNPKVFTNYAIGGARARTPGFTDLGGQLRLFLNDFGGHGPKRASYVVWLGGNDVRDALLNPATSDSILQQAVDSIRDALIALHGAGARKFLVPNAPDVGLTPALLQLDKQLPGIARAASALSIKFNRGLELMLKNVESSLRVDIVRLDVFGILHEAVAAPAALGLTNVTESCIHPNVTVNPYCDQPRKYLFWDGIHPTAAGHRIIARRAQRTLEHETAREDRD
jgi:phospholipase/lecithinase/hemolysin